MKVRNEFVSAMQLGALAVGVSIVYVGLCILLGMSRGLPLQLWPNGYALPAVQGGPLWSLATAVGAILSVLLVRLALVFTYGMRWGDLCVGIAAGYVAMVAGGNQMSVAVLLIVMVLYGMILACVAIKSTRGFDFYLTASIGLPVGMAIDIAFRHGLFYGSIMGFLILGFSVAPIFVCEYTKDNVSQRGG